MDTCSIEGCGRPLKVKSRRLCNRHYRRFQRHGDPLAGGIPNGEPFRYYTEIVLNHHSDECLFWPYGRISAGYALMSAEGKDRYVHRYVCAAENGPPPTPRHEAAHSCGNGHLGCVSRKHLSWKTPADNQRDKRLHGTDNRGHKHPLAKLTEEQVRQIRAMGPDISCLAVARQYGVTDSAIYAIREGITWKHLR